MPLKIKEVDSRQYHVAAELAVLQRLAYRQESLLIGMKSPLEAVRAKDLAEAGERFWVFFEGGYMAAAIGVQLNGRRLEISRLMVHPDHQGKGIAQLLFNTACLALHKKFDTLYTQALERNDPAVRFYKKNGLSVVNKIPFYGGRQVLLDLEKKV